MEFPEDLLYTDQDEWIRVDGMEATIGITDYAQDQLGDIVYVELPEDGSVLKRGQSFGTVESVKAVSDLFSPVDGTVITANDALAMSPELVNQSPYGNGWMIRVQLTEALDASSLMNAADYARLHENG